MTRTRSEFAADTPRARSPRRSSAPTCSSASRRRHRHARDGRDDGARPDRLRAGQPDPEILRRGGARAARRDHGHRPQRLSRTRSTTSSASRSSSAARSTCRATTINDEMKLAARARWRAGEGRRARLRAARVRRATASLRTRVPDPEAVRPARAAHHPRGEDPDRRRIAHPILLVRREEIAPLLQKYHIDPAQLTIIDIAASPHYDRYAARFAELRRRDGITVADAKADPEQPQLLRDDDARGRATPTA
jgi:hypothetical protein